VRPIKGVAFSPSSPTKSLVCLFYVAASLAAAQINQAQETVDIIVGRMVAAVQKCKSRDPGFAIRREYQLFDKKWESKAQVVIRITFVPPNRRRYEIESSRGGIGERILRDIVSREMEAPDAVSQKDLTPENYEFRLLGNEMLDGRRCYVLGLNPRREEKDVIRGRAWVDAETYHLLRIEGDPVKSPSWWIRDLHIVMTFADVDGMWMRTLTHAVANVRFRGKYVMVSRNLEPNPTHAGFQASGRSRSATAEAGPPRTH
jgi:hypothetical protein